MYDARPHIVVIQRATVENIVPYYVIFLTSFTIFTIYTYIGTLFENRRFFRFFVRRCVSPTIFVRSVTVFYYSITFVFYLSVVYLLLSTWPAVPRIRSAQIVNSGKNWTSALSPPHRHQ